MLDRLLGEPERWHPLVGLGWYVDWLETRLNPNGQGRIGAGALAALILLAPFVGLSIAVSFLGVIP
ncbi:cobalamin biosynthesis protein [Tamilnaduibacter salinus]|uniref:cobalamin biosynthesis protein n=1 Tax=Tamilnaduibacter salinus TaxID=1484056 RepID=UPI003C6FA6D6